ncbi:TatD family hydrolase [Bernardetia sp.]|uniref:TatD family hydrolase n=1 Tax=Bernardetia sp. TaxID=1937974 RepID=UPI0025BFCF0F|nr:TatD family hydrolase [Bernardetia sp.]
MNFIDTHAHLYDKKFKADWNELVDRLDSTGIERVYLPNIDRASIEPMFEVEEKDKKRFIPMMGLHPCSVKKDFEKELYIVEEWLNKRKFSAVGEIGLDLYWDKTFFEQQKEAFKIQINWAKKFDIPIAIHTRESTDEALEILEEMKDESLKGVFHCFGGTQEQAERIQKLGFLMGIGGVVTYKNGGLDKVLPSVDLQHLILETDAPYLSPVPHRGKRNESSYIPIIAKKVAEIKGLTIKEVAEKTTQNAKELFTSI